jgi:hypothetical protein
MIGAGGWPGAEHLRGTNYYEAVSPKENDSLDVWLNQGNYWVETI